MKITRRDFVNSALVGSGVALLNAHSPLDRAIAAASSKPYPPDGYPGADWYGFGGVGDYKGCHGNSPRVVADAHAIRHGEFDRADGGWKETGEAFDLVVVGAGMAGLGAALEFHERAGGAARCLILDNHEVFGGEAKQNEFDVNGVHLMAPQGANGFAIPPRGGGELTYASGDSFFYDRLDLPRQYQYPEQPAVRVGNDNYGFLYWLQHQIDTSQYYPPSAGRQHGVHVRQPWETGFRDAPISDRERQALVEANSSKRRPHTGADPVQWADQYSVQQYLEEHMRLAPNVTSYLDPLIASIAGASCNAVSAAAMVLSGFPGARGYVDPGTEITERHSFPGGNSGFARFFLKRMMPNCIAGGSGLEDVINGGIRFAELDRENQRIRLRLSATVVRVEHDSADPERSTGVWVTYKQHGELRRVRAKAVVMASGGWVNKHVVRDLPEGHRKAYDSFNHAPFLVANVALTNWRFMHTLGISACLYQGDFGFSCNIRRPMSVGRSQGTIQPDAPAVLTFYVPFYTPGESAGMQGHLGRAQLFGTSYATYENKIVGQMNELFSAGGFNAKRDIAGIVLNRWGHAYVIPEPGFMYGRAGNPAARDVVAKRHGRVAFGHSELAGFQHWGPAAMQGRRAYLDVQAAL
ncbi:MAG: FAD-binding protein [Dehalococcoidia bacterium]